MLRRWMCAGVVLLSSGVHAQWLQNDHFAGNGSVDSSGAFGFLEGPSVILSAADAGRPVEVVGLDILAVPYGGNGGTFLSAIFDVWSDHYPDAGANPWPPKTQYGDIQDGSGAMGAVQLTPSASQFNRAMFASPVVLDGGSIFVRLLNQVDPCGGFDTTIADDLGPLTPGVNFYSHSYFNYNPLPYDGGTFRILGNWIIRAVLAGGSTPPDAGGGGGDGGGGGGGDGGGGGGGGDGGLVLTSINPVEGFSGEDTAVVLLGQGFEPGAVGLIGTTPVSSLIVTSPAVLNGTVSKGMSPGTYDVLVVNPNGVQAKLPNGFTIHSGTKVGTGCSCGAGANLPAVLAYGVMLAWALSLVRRPRRAWRRAAPAPRPPPFEG